MLRTLSIPLVLLVMLAVAPAPLFAVEEGGAFGNETTDETAARPLIEREGDSAAESGEVANSTSVAGISVAEAADGAPTVELLSLDENGAVLRVGFPEPVLSVERIDGRDYTRVRMPGVDCEQTPGLPELPVYQIRLLVPPGARPTVEHTVRKVDSLSTARPLPVPEYVEVRENDVVTLRPVYDPASYETSTPEAASTLPVARYLRTDAFRGWSLARFELRPVEWSDGMLTVRRSLRLEVSFGQDVTDRAAEGGGGLTFNDHDDIHELLVGLVPLTDLSEYHHWALPRPEAPEPVYNSSDLPRPALKIVVDADGVYRVTPEDLTAAGWDPTVIDPRRLALYSGSSRMLDQDYIYDEIELEAVPVRVDGADDGSFDEGDALYFWGGDALAWDLPDPDEAPEGAEAPPSRRNHYSDFGYYWLVLEDDPLRFSERDAAVDDEVNLPHLQGRVHFERDNRSHARLEFNPEGIDFYWDNTIPENREWTVSVELTGYYAAGGESHLAQRIRATYSGGAGLVRLYTGSDVDPDRLIDGFSLTSPLVIVERWCSIAPELFTPGNNSLTYYIQTAGDARLDSAVDAVDVLYPRDLRARNGLLSVWGGFGQSGRHRLEAAGLTSDEIAVWDTTRGEALVNFELAGTEGYRDVIFAWDVEPDAHLVVADLERAAEPLDIYPDTPSRLHELTNVDIIYIAHPDFIAALDPLIDLHASRGYSVEAVRVDDIYDEFSGGRMDPVAIRSFLARVYAQSPDHPPVYVVLVGDGSYDYRDSEGIQSGPLWRDFGENLIPPLYTYVPRDNAYYPSDNYYSSVYPTEPSTMTPQMAVSRISVVEAAELETIVERGLSYGGLPGGPWQMRSVSVSDNSEDINYGNGPSNDIDFDYYPEEIDELYDSASTYNDKIYLTSLGMARTGLDQYNYENYSPTQLRRAARENINPLITEDESGALLYNYFGHGAWNTWTTELSFTQRPPLLPDVPRWSKDEPPLLIHSTCSLADFERTKNTTEEPESLCELLNRIPGGVVGAVASSRLTGGGTAQRYHRTYLDGLFHPEDHLETPNIGLVHLRTLLATGNESHWDRWVFFGDGPLPLRRPVEGLSLDLPSAPSVSRGEVITVGGEVTDASLGIDTVHIVAYDRPQIPYTWNAARLFRPVVQVSASVVDGAFEAQLPLPWKIDDDLNPELAPRPSLERSTPPSVLGGLADEANGEPNNLDYYGLEIHAWAVGVDGTTLAVDGPWNPGGGSIYEGLPIVGGIDPPDDNEGPVVEFTFDDGATASGDLVDGEVDVRIDLQDPHGILTARSDGGLGGISGEIDRPIVLSCAADGHSLELDLTEAFDPTPGDYTRGSVERTLELPAGDYTLTLICYDRFGERGLGSAQLRVSDELTLEQVLVVPNPAPGPTAFTFIANQRPDSARIRIYTTAGRLVRTLEPRALQAGFNVIEWDGDDEGGRPLANGVYLYSVELSSGGESTEVFEKFIMLR